VVETLPILKIFDFVGALFTAEATTASLVFGNRETAKQLNQGPGRANRVVFAPEGKAGGFVSARAPGRNPRPLCTFVEVVTVYVHAVDTTALNDQRAQYTACRMLLDAVVRAIQLAARSQDIADLPLKIGEAQWVGDNVERQFGAELAFALEVHCAVPDQAYPTQAASPTMGADLDVEGDLTEDI
jgi:hypothetical protein